MKKLASVILLLISFLPATMPVIAQEEHIHITTPNERFLNEKPDTGFISSLIKQAIALKDTATDSSLLILENTLALSKQINYIDGIARSLNAMGLCYTEKDMYDQAIATLNEAIPYCMKATTYKELLVDAYNNLSIPYHMKGEYITSINYLYKALEVFENKKIVNPFMKASLYCNLAGLLLSIEEDDKALSFLDKAQSYATQINNSSLQARILANIGGVYYQKNELKEALPNFQKALELSKKSNNTSLTKSILQNIGKYYLKQGQPREAIQYLNQALEINTQSFSDNILIYYDLSNAFYQIKYYKKAEDILLQVEQFARTTGIKAHLTDAYLTLSSLYANTGRYKEAYEQQEEYVALYESVLNNESAKQYHQAEIKYQTAEKDKQLAEKQLLIASQQSRIKEKNILIISISIILLLLAIMSVTLYSNTQHKRKVEQLQAIMEGEENERKRIARDLHDGISQTISAAKINLVAMENDINFNSAEQKQKFDKIIKLVDDGFKEVRTISHNMMPKALLESGLALVLKQFIDTIDSNVIRISLYTKGFEEHFDSAIETILYRVIQECVANVMKHAHATQMDISLIKDKNSISVTIEDNGTGFNMTSISRATGVGIKNIQSRINFLNGKLEIDSSPGNGTLVSIYIPYT